MPSTVNQLVVAELATRFREMRHAVLVDFTGVNALQADRLRAALGERGAGMLVVKNTLAILALRQLEFLDVADLIDGPTAFIHGSGDPAALAKMVLAWSKAEKVLAVRGGMLDGEAVDAEAVMALAALPSLDVLHALVAGAMAAPLSGFAGVLNAVPRDFARVVRAIAEKQEEQEATNG